MAFCLKLAALGLGGQCVASVNGAELAQFNTETTSDPSMVVRCGAATACHAWVAKDADHIVIPMPRHRAYLLLSKDIPESVVGEFAMVAAVWDRQ